MRKSNLFHAPRLLLLFFMQPTLLFLLLQPTTSFAIIDNDLLFLQCLDLHSHPNYLTSELTYTQQNTSFPSILQAYARNLRFLQPDRRKPSFIITPKHESNVIATINCCKIHRLELRIRGGGRDMEGSSFTSSVPFVILDMFNLRAIDVNVEEETAWVEAGAQLGEVYYKIAEKSSRHAFPGGVCPTVGVTGHFTGGGYGNLMRKYGLSSDNIIDVIVVDVYGRVLNRETMGESFFWALRGGGAASFGVVLAFKVRLVRVPPKVTVFQVARDFEQGCLETLYKWQEVAPNLPKELFLRARTSTINDQGGQNKVVVTFIALFLGESKELIDVLANTLPQLGISVKDCIEMPWIQSTLFWAGFHNGASTEVLLSRDYERLSRKVKSDYVTKPIPQEALELMWKELINMDGLVMEWNPHGGRMNEIPKSVTPYYHREGYLFKIEYDFKWHEEGKEAEQHHVELSRRIYEFMTSYVSNSPRDAFFNYKDFDIGTNPGRYQKTKAEFGVKYYGSNFQRLVKVKSQVDPLNFFRNEQSIPLFINLI